MSPARPEQALALLSAGTALRRERTSELAARLASAVDWDLLLAMLRERRLLAQLGQRIVELSGGCAPARFHAALAQTLAQTRRQGALLELVAMRLTRELSGSGIASLLLKGAFLGEAIYGDPGRREAADIDLLVSPHDLPRAVELARGSGYRRPVDHVGCDGLPLLHHALAHEQGSLPPLELHWRLHWYEREFALEMLRRAGADARWGLRACPTDELTALLLFYARDGFLDLRLATDLGAWWDAFGSSVPRGALATVLERHPALERAVRASLHVAEQLVGLPASRLLGSARPPGARVRLAARLANPCARGEPAQMMADVGMVDWMLTPRGGQAQFVRRQLLPPRQVLIERSRAGGTRRVSSLGHGVRVLGRYGLTIARLRDSGSGASATFSRHAHRTPLLSVDAISSTPV